MHSVAAVIVTHNSEDVIERCIASLGEASEIVVVDNASTDRTAEIVSSTGARLIGNRTNRGFAAAVNQGAGATNAPVLLVCNPDVEAIAGFELLAELAMQHGAATGMLAEGDDERYGCRRLPRASTLCFEVLGLNAVFPRNPVNRRYRYFDRQPFVAGEVEQPAGAFVAIRRDVFEQLGGFDERFSPVWFEDVDFFNRVTAAGFFPWYDPAVRARHTGAHSVGKLKADKRQLYWYGSLVRYAEKYFPRQQLTAVCACVLVGAGLRAVGKLFSSRNGDAVAAFWPVARLALGGLLTGQVRPARTGSDRASARESHSSVSGPIQ